MTKITLSRDAMDAMTADGLRAIKQDCANDTSTHPQDKACQAVVVAACDALLAYLGKANDQ